MGILISILATFGAALLCPVAVRLWKWRAGFAIAAAPGGLFLFFMIRSGASIGTAEAFSLPWAPSLGLNLSIREDGLSLLFALLISGMGFIVTLYSASYMKGRPELGRYYGWLMAFTAAMLGLVLTDNLLLLYVFWELTSVTSFMLIGYNHEEDAARAAALQSLLVTSMGGLALLAGSVLIGLAGGSFELSTLIERRAQLGASPLLIPATALILLGAFTKSAQFPFHFWLPNAMVAPTPISAYLHSAAMVKAGIYLLARLHPALGDNEFWIYAVSAAGAVTLLLGGYMALLQTDLKLLLAYSTVSALGLMTLLIGIGVAHALEAAIVFLLAHALYKGCLFLVAGAVDHGTGVRNADMLGGLLRPMPRTAIAGSIAALSMAGVVPLFGAIAKELSYEVGIGAGPWTGVAVLAGGISFVFVAAMTGIGPFWAAAGNRHSLPAHEPPSSMWFGPALLSLATVTLGIAPALAASLLGPAVAAVTRRAAEMHLAVWPGLKPAFLLSLATIVAGALLYRSGARVRRVAQSLALKRGPERLYHASLRWMNAVAMAQTRMLQTGYLRYYLIITVLTMSALIGGPLVLGGGVRLPHGKPPIEASDLLLAALVLLAAALAVRSRSILGAVAAMGAAGYGVATIFMVFGAPDLAMTQFLIESLTVILFVLVFYKIPSFKRLSSIRSRLFDAAVALLGGGLVALLVLMASATQLHAPISDYFLSKSLSEGHGRNVVNVILVDFRALDTMGEATVLGIAAIGVYALIKSGKTSS